MLRRPLNTTTYSWPPGLPSTWTALAPNLLRKKPNTIWTPSVHLLDCKEPSNPCKGRSTLSLFASKWLPIGPGDSSTLFNRYFLSRFSFFGFCPVGYSFSLLVGKPIRSDPHDFNCEVQIELFMVWVDVAC